MSQSNKVLAFIPARGGSKRLPGKNILPFAGKPLIHYSIALARASQFVDRLVVSTDDADIERVAVAHGAEVIRRPSELATDHAPTAAAIRHAVLALRETGYFPDLVVTLQPTNPLRTVALLDRAITLFLENTPAVDSVITVSPNHHKFGTISGQRFLPQNYTPGSRSQDLNPLYFENGLIYVCGADLIVEREDTFGQRILPLITDDLFSWGDIDTLVDFQITEFLYREYRSILEEGLSARLPGETGGILPDRHPCGSTSRTT